jgi:hypothetical protein
MFISIFVPEASLAKALLDFVAARDSTKKLCSLAEADGAPWSLTHTFLVNMGGLMIEFPDSVEDSPQARGEQTVEKGAMPILSHEQRTDEEKALGGDGSATGTAGMGTPEILPLPQSESATCSGKSELRDSGRLSVDVAGNTRTNPASSNHLPEGSASDDDDKVTIRRLPKSAPWLANIDAYLRTAEGNFAGWRQKHGEGPWRVCPRNRELVYEAFRVFQSHTNHQDTLPPSEKNEEFIRALKDSYIRANWRYLVSRFQGNVWLLNGDQLIYAREIGLIKEIPRITRAEIDSQNGGDIIVKVISVYQLLWLVVNICARYRADQAVSQLEIMTLAFAISSTITYAFLWAKPQGTSIPKTIKADRFALPNEIVQLGLIGSGMWGVAVPRAPFHAPDGSYSRARDGTGFNAFGYIALSSFVFGALHFLAWDFRFPTPVERELWRVSAVITTVNPFTLMTAGGLFWRGIELCFGGSEWKMNEKLERVVYIVVGLSWRLGFWIVSLAYVGARVYIMVEVFRTLAFLPPSAFDSTSWENALKIG